MNLLLKNNLWLFILLFIFGGCENKWSKYYQKNTNDWKKYAQEIGADSLVVQNSIILVLKSSECSPGLAELQWWDDYRLKNTHVDIQLVILERYAATFQTLLNHENLHIPAFRDSAGILFKHDLLPTTPMKLYFNEDGVIKKMASIGSAIDPDQNKFISAIREFRLVV